jgi:dolichyl-phosphate beta-glucosyltransferase
MYSPTPVYLSVVIPAYNEEERIADSLYALKDYLHAREYRSEIIIVDDGSCDLTSEIVKFIDIYGEEIREQERGSLVANGKNMGKGFSIARGILQARGEIILTCDTDLSIPIAEVEKFLPYFSNGYSVVVGSRFLHDSQGEVAPFYRRVFSLLFGLCVRVLVMKGIADTQCGFKAYHREAAHRIARLQKIHGFGYDVEHLYLAQKLGYRVKEVPVTWKHHEGSKVNILKDSWIMFRDLVRIRMMHRALSVTSSDHRSPDCSPSRAERDQPMGRT